MILALIDNPVFWSWCVDAIADRYPLLIGRSFFYHHLCVNYVPVSIITRGIHNLYIFLCTVVNCLFLICIASQGNLHCLCSSMIGCQSLSPLKGPREGLSVYIILIIPMISTIRFEWIWSWFWCRINSSHWVSFFSVSLVGMVVFAHLEVFSV